MREKTYIIFLFFTLFSCFVIGQQPMTKADVLFFEYEYADAIAEYRREMVQKPLTNQQYLNLADAYFQTGNFNDASETYFEVYKKDSTMSSHHFNKMLQAMTKTSGLDRTKAILATRTSEFSSELLENADFNFEIRTSDTIASNFKVFNVDGNSPQADFAPSFYEDRLLFTSSRQSSTKGVYEPSGESFFQIFIARTDNQGNYQIANPFTEIPNSNFHQATPYYSDQLKHLFYVSSNQEDGEMLFDENGKNSLAILMANQNGLSRFVLKNLSTSFYYPFYDAKSERLYFAANIEGGYGGTDIYYTLTNAGAIMSAPINLGPRINSPGNEIAPYILEGSLYFSSDVFYGHGGMDIYKSEIDKDYNFSIPVNLGIGINSSSDDFGLIVRNNGEDGLVGYYASNRPGGKGKDDIYGFHAEKAPGLRTVIMQGQVVNSVSSDGISKARVLLINSEGATIKEAYTEENGDFRMEVPYQFPLELKIDKERHSSFSDSFNEIELDSLETGELRIALNLLDDLVEEREDQTVIKLQDFYFSRGSSSLNTEITTELDKVVEIISMFPQLQLRIESHTDSRGGSATNFRISQNRANAIRDYLLENGVSSSNILYTIGYGEDKILNKCTNGVYCLDFLHKKNERQLIVILNYNILF